MTGATEPLVLVIEDEVAMRRFLRTSLGVQGYRVIEAGTAKEGLSLAAGHNPTIILLDLGLPDLDGISLTRSLREWSKTPIIVISARGRENDKVEALDAGADDYLTKPFGLNELLARMRVAMRHAAKGDATAQPTFDLDNLHVDFVKRTVKVGEREVHLTPIEYKLLALLAQHAGKVLTHRQILKEVWGPGYATQSHYVRVHMAELRKKIEADPARPAWILTEPGVGYRLREASR